MRSYIVTFITTVVAFSSSISLYAQSKTPPPPDGTRMGPVLPELTPIDTYEIVLLTIGIFYGIYILYKLKAIKKTTV